MASYSDNFNRSNGALGSDYDTVTGWSSLQVVSNEAYGSGSFNNGNTVDAAAGTFADDQEASVTVAAVGSFDFAGILLRFDPTTGNGYLLKFDGSSSGSGLYRVDGGSLSGQLPDGTPENDVVVGVGDVVRFRAEGTTLTAYVDDVEIVSYDTSGDGTAYSSGQPGLYYQTGNNRVTRIDDFSATDELGGATTTVSIDQSDPPTVEVGDSGTLTATVTDGSGSTTWSSDDASVSINSSTGAWVADGTGTATVTATNNGASDTITFNVSAAQVESEAVNAVEDEVGAVSATLAARVSGTVTLSGSPVSGATVRLIDTTDETYAGDVTTNASGEYSFGASFGVDAAHTYAVIAEHDDGTEYVRARAFITPEA